MVPIRVPKRQLVPGPRLFFLVRTVRGDLRLLFLGPLGFPVDDDTRVSADEVGGAGLLQLLVDIIHGLDALCDPRPLLDR